MAVNWKRQCLKRDGYKCRLCGAGYPIIETNKGRYLHVHHIDLSGVILFGSDRNNNIDNLITLCPPCHQKEHAKIKDVIFSLKINNNCTLDDIAKMLKLDPRVVAHIFNVACVERNGNRPLP